MKKDLHPKWPYPPLTLSQRLLHAVDIFAGEDSDMKVLTATTNQYAPHGEQHSWTGLTLGDLRILLDIAVGRAYTAVDYDAGCQFLYTGAAGPRTCCRCGAPMEGNSGADCPKKPKR